MFVLKIDPAQVENVNQHCLPNALNYPNAQVKPRAMQKIQITECKRRVLFLNGI
jgi:hypothetical protein